MRWNAAVGLFVFCSFSNLPFIPLLAADFEDGVPVDVVNVLVGGSLSDELPADFPSFTLPAGVEIVGVLDRNVGAQAAIASSLSLDETMNALNEALMAAGWMPMPAFDDQQPAVGFVDPQTPQARRSNMELCRDDLGTVSIMQSPFSAEAVMLSFNRSRTIDPVFSCVTRIQQMQQSGAMRFGANRPILQYMPRLELPQENVAALTAPLSFARGNFSGSNNEIETSAATGAEMALPALLEHFGRQMRDQGWTAEFEENGRLTGQSNWTRETAGLQLTGMLSIIKLAENRHRLKFILLAMQPGNGASVLNAPAIRNGVSQ